MIGADATQIAEADRLQRIFDLGLVTDYSLAIDGGACVGSWSARMAERFDRVLAFEPCAEAYQILCENMAGFPNVGCHNEALMDARGRVDSIRPREKRARLTSRMVKRNKYGAVRCVAIDELALPSCGLIKLDLEGAEGLALKGAALTIRRCLPVLVVEMGGISEHFGQSVDGIHRVIKGFGYDEVFRDGVDRVYVPRGSR